MGISQRCVVTMFVGFALSSAQLRIFAQTEQMTPPKYPDVSRGRGTGTKGDDDRNKLMPELRMLLSQYTRNAKGDSGPLRNGIDPDDLRDIFGITDLSADDPVIGIAVTSSSVPDVDALKRDGMKVFMRQGETVYGRASVRALPGLARIENVTRISAIKTAKTPGRPNDLPEQGVITLPTSADGMKASSTKNLTKSPPLANEFSKAKLTGKGVIVGVIDTGIDWRHKDFINPDGSSRIIAIWDLLDDSFRISHGKIGTSPPQLDPQGEPLRGTIYTNGQINAALKGSGTVNSTDNFGHGTATAGTAAGNGRSTSGQFAGVAPEADLIIVKAADCGGFVNEYIYGAAWMVKMAKEMKRPIVVNQSFGGHFSAHDGTEQEEVFLNSLTGKGIPGVVFTVSAGNEGRYSMHAAGQFGPRKEGQQDITSPALTVDIPVERAPDGTLLLGVFDSRDEWGAIVKPSGTTILVDKNSKPIWFYLFKTNGELRYLLGDGLEKPDWFDGFVKNLLANSRLGAKTDILVLSLPAGQYRLWGFGATKTVVSGNFDFYAPNYQAADFGVGTVKSGMVGSPGNATNAITVGAYNFRRNWLNSEGTESEFNLPLDEISNYSSPGGKRRGDGVVKPDVAAPATYTISPLSSSSTPESKACEGDNMGAGLGKRYITSDGTHIAWSGTSASSPFTAGVVALMLQKNRMLDAEQVRQILIRTAKKGGVIGGVPNPAWGNGMLNAGAAVAATPVGKKHN